VTGSSLAGGAAQEPHGGKEDRRPSLLEVRKEVDLVRRAIENPAGAKFMSEVFEAAVEAWQKGQTQESQGGRGQSAVKTTYFVC